MRNIIGIIQVCGAEYIKGTPLFLNLDMYIGGSGKEEGRN